MQTLYKRISIMALSMFSLGSLVFGQIAGDWQGTLEIPGGSLSIVFHLEVDDDAKVSGTMDSPDQGAKGIKIKKGNFEDEQLRLSIAGGAIRYNAQFKNDSLIGTFFQSGAELPLNLTRMSPESSGPNRPQTPSEPFDYEQEEVRYKNETSGLFLAGTLTYPKGEGPFPAAILITGSGAQDRDETIFDHKPFWVIADYLTQNHGMAVLRVDDRGVGGSEGDPAAATSEDFAGDVAAGIQFLRKRTDIDREKIGLIGHSEGGLIGPKVAAKDPNIAFVIMLAGPGLPGHEILLIQEREILAGMGIESGVLDQYQEYKKELLALIMAETKQDEALRSAKALLKKHQDQFTEEQLQTFSMTNAGLKAQLDIYYNPWFNYFMKYDPRPTLEQLSCPVLALNGTKDLQVPAQKNLDEIEKALKKGGNTQFETEAVDELNHLFQHCETGLPLEYNQIEETFDPASLKRMGKWLSEQLR